MIRRILIALGILTTLIGSASPARAQVAEVIHRYDVAIETRGDGTLGITETIDYDFGSSPHHGIFRDVPTRLRYDDTRDRLYGLTVSSVTATDAPADYTVEEIAGGLTRIKIGDPDVEVTGRHTYTLAYSGRDALNPLPDHDELY